MGGFSAEHQERVGRSKAKSIAQEADGGSIKRTLVGRQEHSTKSVWKFQEKRISYKQESALKDQEKT